MSDDPIDGIQRFVEGLQHLIGVTDDRMGEKELITAIVNAVRQRGYLDGYDTSKLAARQVVKAAEELGEMAVYVYPPRVWWKRLWFWAFGWLARWARRLFDSGDCGFVPANDWCWHGLKGELSDLTVVMCIMASCLSIETGDHPALLLPALLKAQADVERGVREDGN